MIKSPIAVSSVATLLACISISAEARQSDPQKGTNLAEASVNSQTNTRQSKIELVWLTNFPKAQATAKAEGKFILLFFHGSDWCPPCVEMQRQVFESPAFIDYARRTLVLMDVDFPEKPSQSVELRRNNMGLKAKFNLSKESGEGYPTIVLLNQASEVVFQETGYAGGGTAEVLPKLLRHTEIAAPAPDPAGFKNLDVDEFARMATDHQNVILDVRTPMEFKAGHLPNAINLDVNAGNFDEKVVLLNPNTTYLVHCASGVRSVKACEKLGQLHFSKLYNLPGGFRAWVRAGKPIEK